VNREAKKKGPGFFAKQKCLVFFSGELTKIIFTNTGSGPAAYDTPFVLVSLRANGGLISGVTRVLEAFFYV